MKKIICFFALAFCCLTSCDDDDEDGIMTYDVNVQLKYAADAPAVDKDSVKVKLTSSTGTAFEAYTDAAGEASFKVPVGIYEASASDRFSQEGYVYNFNGLRSGIAVTDTWTGEEVTEVEMISSRSGQLVIKELYNGGVMKDDGSGKYQFDKYVVLYNNSDEPAVLSNFCLGMANPYNGESPLNDYKEGKLTYADQGFIPAGCAIWYLPKDFVLQPGEDALIAFFGAIDHTVTYKNSVDLSHADYCTYDLDDFDNANYYPTPSENIPEANYFKANKFGMANAWPLSVASPAFFIFATPEGLTPEQFASTDDYHYTANKVLPAFCCAKVKTDWILDAIEVFSTPNVAKSNKRLTPNIDAGYVTLTNFSGHTLYRNVDKAATEAIAENEGKLVYDYDLGFENSSDPSGIDAEASLKKGARIIFQDTNNSTNDFHERVKSSLK